ncbi:MAG: S8 family serine peptidase, partial [Candidatus Hermodarchaeia archaeon]
NNDSSLGPQPFDQIPDFSSAGPTPQALPKPDCVAPGAWAWDITFLQDAAGNGNNAFSTFGGTSASAPMGAGVAALIFQALAEPLGAIPDGEQEGLVKTIIKSSCDDIKQPPLRQGSGRINAYKAVKLAFLNDSSSIWFASNHTFAEFDSGGSADHRAGWWRAVYMQMDYLGTPGLADYTPYSYTATDYSGVYFPFMDAGFTTHQVFSGTSEYHNVSSTTGDGGDIDYLDAIMYQEFNSSSHTFTSTSTYTTYPLFGTYSGVDNFDAIFMDQFFNRADYAIIYIQYNRDKFEALQALATSSNYVCLHDWNDTNGNNVIDFQSSTSKGEVRRVGFDYSGTNCHQVHIGDPGAQWMGYQNATLYYHDVGIELFLWRSLDVIVTIRLFEKVDWDWFTFTQYSSSGPIWNVSYSVPVDTDPGIYAGFVVAKLGLDEQLFPITCRVDGQVTPGSTLTWGGCNGRPYDNTAITGALNYQGEYMSGEWRYYYIDVAADAPPNFTTWVMTNVSWQDPETNVDVMLYMTGYGSRGFFPQGWQDSTYEHIKDGYWVGSPTGLNPPQNVLLLDWTWDPWVSATDRGYLMIVLHISAYGGHFIPEELTITVAPVDNDTLSGCYGCLPEPTGNIVVNSGSKHVDDTLVEDAVFEGPHALTTGTFDPYTLPGFPSIRIKQTDLQYRFNNETTFHGRFVEANATPNTNFNGPPWDAMFEWPGIVAGMPLYLELLYETNPRTWWPDLEIFLLAPNGITFVQNLFPFCPCKIIEIIAPVNGTYIVGVDYFDDAFSPLYTWFSGWDYISFEVHCTATSIFSHIADGLTVTTDTAELDLNLNLDLVLRGLTGTSLDKGYQMFVVWRNVRFINFFAPTLTLLNPTAGDVRGLGPFAINWTAS